MISYRYNDPMGIDDPWSLSECQFCYNDSIDTDEFYHEPRCIECANMEQEAYDEMLTAINMSNGHYKERDIERMGDCVQLITDNGVCISNREGAWELNMKASCLQEVVNLLNSDK